MIVALVTLIITIGVETGIALLLQRSGIIRAHPARLRIDVPLVNLMTHPIATIAIRNFGASFTRVEILVVCTEFLAYRYVTRMTWIQAALLSVVANGATIVLSLILL